MKLSKPFHTAVRRFRRRTEGISAVEMALIMPVLLLCVCGIVDFGNLGVNWIMVTNAARTGASVAVNAPTYQSALQTTVRSKYGSDDGTPNNNLTVTTDPPTPPPVRLPDPLHPGAKLPGTEIKVTVTTPVSLITPMISAFFQSNPVTVTGTATWPQEY